MDIYSTKHYIYIYGVPVLASSGTSVDIGKSIKVGRSSEWENGIQTGYGPLVYYHRNRFHHHLNSCCIEAEDNEDCFLILAQGELTILITII